MLINIVLASIVIMLASLAGVFSVWKKAGHFIEKNLSYLVSFSAGVFLIIACTLAKETFEHSGSYLWVVLGAIVIFILFKILPSFHHHHSESDHVHSRLDARRILFSDGIHNIGDGILLTASFAAGPFAGVIASISIFVHELVQEVSEFFVLRQAGYSMRKALFWNFLISITILLGSVGSYFLLDYYEYLEPPVLGLAAGAFFVVVFFDLIPHSVRTSKNKTNYVKHAFWFILGIAIMFLISEILSH